jgi:hypothetical protein
MDWDPAVALGVFPDGKRWPMMRCPIKADASLCYASSVKKLSLSSYPHCRPYTFLIGAASTSGFNRNSSMKRVPAKRNSFMHKKLSPIFSVHDAAETTYSRLAIMKVKLIA